MPAQPGGYCGWWSGPSQCVGLCSSQHHAHIFHIKVIILQYSGIGQLINAVLAVLEQWKFHVQSEIESCFSNLVAHRLNVPPKSFKIIKKSYSHAGLYLSYYIPKSGTWLPASSRRILSKYLQMNQSPSTSVTKNVFSHIVIIFVITTSPSPAISVHCHH
jgi:hypothetical protein